MEIFRQILRGSQHVWNLIQFSHPCLRPRIFSQDRSMESTSDVQVQMGRVSENLEQLTVDTDVSMAQPVTSVLTVAENKDKEERGIASTSRQRRKTKKSVQIKKSTGGANSKPEKKRTVSATVVKKKRTVSSTMVKEKGKKRAVSSTVVKEKGKKRTVSATVVKAKDDDSGISEEPKPSMSTFMSKPVPEQSKVRNFTEEYLRNKKAPWEPVVVGVENIWINPKPPKLVAYPFEKFLAKEYKPLSEKEPIKGKLKETIDGVGKSWRDITESSKRTQNWNAFVDTWNWLRYDTYDYEYKY